MTTKRKIFFFIPFAIVVCFLVYSWYVLLFDEYSEPHFTNYLGVIFFVPVLYFLYKDKSFVKPLITLGIYLLLATFKLANIFPYTQIYKVTLGIFGIPIPFLDMNWTALLILILYGCLNFGSLVDIYLDYKEAKGKL